MRRRGWVCAAVAVLCALTGCSGAQRDAGPSTAEARTSSASPAPSRPAQSPSPTRPDDALDTWRVGAAPLPLRPDGFGQVRRTPQELRVREMPTRDLLPPPADGRFRGSVGPITPQVRRRMGASWSAGCPVPLAGLRYLTVSFHGFDGRTHTGELVVAGSVAEKVVEVFRTLFAAGYPIEEMRLVTTADLTAPPTGDGNNTAAFVCRRTRGQTTWSAHAYGLAIDVNPFLNPYHRGGLVLPELAGAYLARGWRRAGMIRSGDAVTHAFAAAGWSWGGDFTRLSDRMHFSATGR